MRTSRKRRRRSRAWLLAALGLGLALTACHNQRARRQFDQGRALHSQGAYLEAIRNWETILSSWPDSDYADRALHRIGTTYYVELDQPDRALAAFLRLVNDYPKSRYAPEDLALVAEIYRGRRQFAKALTQYYRFLKLYTKDETALEISYRMVTCLFEVGEYKAMREQAQELIKKYPGSRYAADCVFWIGETHYLERNYEKARERFKEYLQKYPEGEMAYKARLSYARSLEEDNRLKDAIGYYQELLKRYPEDKIIKSRLESAKKRLANRYDSGASR